MTLVVISTFIGYSLIYQSILDYQANKILVDATLIYLIATFVLFIVAIIISKRDKKKQLI